MYLDKNAVLGSGAFGLVTCGTLSSFPEDVAIKTVKPYADIEYLKALLSELKVMSCVGKHEYVIELIGAYTKEIKIGTIVHCTLSKNCILNYNNLN